MSAQPPAREQPRLWRSSGAGLPRCCRLCGQWGPQALCADCLHRFAASRPRCPRCALATPQGQVCGRCLREPPASRAVLAAVDYGFPWDRLIADLKFNQQPEVARPLAALMAASVAAGQGQAGPAHRVLPVPLSDARLAERGYNQAWALARAVARAHGLPADAEALLRLRDTPHQVGLTRRERLRNMAHAFWVPPEAVMRVRGRQLALVDDVMTTGITAEAATRCLLAAGAAGVQVWVLARTPAPGD